jgi:hypothetical protein
LQDDLCRPKWDVPLATLSWNSTPKAARPRTKKAQEYGGNGPHVCYDYTTVEERFPVRWCTQNGGHIWDHKDPGQFQSWVPQTTWDFFSKF